MLYVSRLRRAVELGFSDLAAYYEKRYRDERCRLEQIAAELGCAESAVRTDPATARARSRPDTLARGAPASAALTFDAPPPNHPVGCRGPRLQQS
jgi:hypothetical protein